MLPIFWRMVSDLIFDVACFFGRKFFLSFDGMLTVV